MAQKNVVKSLSCMQSTGLGSHSLQRISESLIFGKFKKLAVSHFVPSLSTEVTSIAWLGKRLSFVIGTENRFMLQTITKEDQLIEEHSVVGLRRRSFFVCVHYSNIHDNNIITAGTDGTAQLWDLKVPIRSPVSEFSHTGTEKWEEKWCSSVESSNQTGLVLAGDTKGQLLLMDPSLRLLSRHRIHEDRISSIEFNKRDPRLFVTASYDNEVKLFDVRNFDQPIVILSHSRAITCATFNPSTNHKLLTTDLSSEIRIYSSPTWNITSIINHPHQRALMYNQMVPIKAVWHPLTDIIVIGGTDTVSKLDVFSSTFYDLHFQLFETDGLGVININQFFHTGEYMISALGMFYPIWKFEEYRGEI